MDRIPAPPWKVLLQRKTVEHYRRFHPEIFTRRGFLGTAAGAAGLVAASHFSVVPLALAGEKTTAEPNPIPGGGTAFGFFVHHNPLPNDPTVPLSSINDPSEIGDFNGLILDTMIRGGRAPMGAGRLHFARTWAPCRACTSAKTATTTTVHLCSFDWTSTPVRQDRPWLPSRSMTTVQESRPTGFSGLSQHRTMRYRPISITGSLLSD
jgi:hypothetical protein